MKKKNLTKTLHKPVLSKPILLGALGLSILLLLVVLQIQDGIFSSKPAPLPTPTFAPVPTTQAVYNSPTPFFQTFTSPDLGISFTHPSSVDVKEVGNKVYLGRIDPYGLYVQVLPKDPADTLEAAARKQFLQGYSEQKCLFRDNSRNTPHLPSSFIRLSVYSADSDQELDNV